MTLKEILYTLEISELECAKYLDTNPIMFRKWLHEEQPMPHILKQKVAQWVRFHREGLNWKPGWVTQLGPYKDYNIFDSAA